MLGAVLAALGLAGTTYALIQAPDEGASAAVVLAGVGRRARAGRVPRRRAARDEPDDAADDVRLTASSRAANLVTVVVYAALGGVFFLLVAFLQISMG